MSLDKVVTDILRKGEEKKQEIIQLGTKEKDEQVALAEKQISETRARENKRIDAAIVQMEQQELSSAELEVKKALLAAQKQVMEDLKSQILDELKDYPSDKRKKLYGRLAAKAKKELGECYAYTRPEDRSVLQLPAGVTYGGPIGCSGGVVFESKDRMYRLDFRFESLLDEVWNEKLQEIYSKLFR